MDSPCEYSSDAWGSFIHVTECLQHPGKFGKPLICSGRNSKTTGGFNILNT